jgi:glycosyltransferase involved in cell wall biosynthesis
MYKDQKVVVVMPAYNAEKTLIQTHQTHQEVLEQDVVDLIIVVDDASSDQTSAVASELPQTVVHSHIENRGYGANQKTCTDTGDGKHDRQRPVSLRSGVADPGRVRP